MKNAKDLTLKEIFKEMIIEFILIPAIKWPSIASPIHIGALFAVIILFMSGQIISYK